MAASRPAGSAVEADEANLTTVKTACRICLCFCGLDVTTDGKRIVRIRPDKDNPNNWRDFCLKGGSAHHMRDHPKRITQPMKRMGDKYISVPYEQAIREIAAQLHAIRQRHGPNAIATYIGNPGQSSTTGAAFQSGFIAGLGSTSNYTVGSVDQNSFNLNAQEMYGSEMALLNPDVDHSKCILMLGMNPAVSYVGWMYQVPDGWNRILKAQASGADVIMVDPRKTASTKKANTHVKVRPGEDWALLLGIIKVVFDQGWEHKQDCAEANGVDTIRAIAAQASLEHLSARCNVPVAQIEDIARRFATAETAVCFANTGLSQNRSGTIGEWLSHVLNLITGRIDRKGGRFYQPGIFKNTMQLLNKMSPPSNKRSRIGGYRMIYGGFPIATLPDEITTPGDGQIRAMIINSGNPVVAGADGNRLDAAFAQLECLIAIDFFQRESHRHAHWLIPGCHFLEREDFFTILGSLNERPFAQLMRTAVPPRGEVRPEWEFFRDLAVEMGVPFMGIKGLNPLIKASRWVAKVTGKPRLAFNPRWIWALLVRTASCLKWRELNEKQSGYFYAEKSYGHFRAALQTPDKKVHAAPESFVAVLKRRLAEPPPQTPREYPFQLVNQRHLSMMNSWLVETVKRVGSRGDIIEINPADANALGIADTQEVTVSSRTGKLNARARLTEEVPPGIVSMDHGWGSRTFDPLGGDAPVVQGINRNQLVAADELDELTGTPNLNGTYVGLHPA
ncbi:MAG: molybdopterin-dependent oxidoreductase [Steroidobacteraceae bacterium]